MISEPTILVLEDELPQILALRATLQPVGKVVDFSDPQRALDYLHEQEVDAAVIDIHMPHMPLNGVEFIRAVRSFDQHLAVIIRTGDSSIEIAEDAIELHAFRRIIKSRTSVQELRDVLRAGVAETRRRRQLSRDAAATADVARRLEQTLGSIEDELTAAECYKAMLHSLRNQLTAIAGFAEVWSAVAREANHRLQEDTSAENNRVVSRMLADVNAFLEGPFADVRRVGPKNACTDVNATLDVLRKRFGGSNPWSIDRKAFEVVGGGQPFLVAPPSVKLLTALRHVTEYCLQSSAPGARVALNADYVRDLDRLIQRTPASSLVFNRPNRPSSTGYVCLHFTSTPFAKDLAQIQRDFHSYPEDPRTGNLHMLSLSLGEETCTTVVQLSATMVCSLSVLLPAAG